MGGWQVGQGIDLLAASGAQHRSPDKKQRQIAAYFGGNAQLVFRRELDAQSALQAKHRRDRIRRRCPQTTLHRQALVNLNDDLASKGHGFSRAATRCVRTGL